MNYFKVGTIVNTQGLKGEVRVISTTDFPEERYKKGSRLVIFRENQSPLEVTVAHHRKHKVFDILSFAEFNRIEEVEPFKNGILQVAEDQLTDLSEDEFYYHEIIGLTVLTEAGESLGTITEILSPGANDVWVVEQKGKKALYIPYIEPVVKTIDLAQGTVTIHLLEGMIDE